MFKIFSREPHLFFKKKQFLNVLRNLTVWLAFNSEIDTFSHFKKIHTSSENLFIFSKKQKYFEQFERNANFSCIPQQNCYLQSFQSEFIFLENPCTLLEQPNVWTFWEMLVFQLNSTANCYRQPIFTISSFLFKKPIFFSFKNAWSLNFLRTVTISVDSTANFLPLPF